MEYTTTPTDSTQQYNSVYFHSLLLSIFFFASSLSRSIFCEGVTIGFLSSFGSLGHIYSENR